MFNNGQDNCENCIAEILKVILLLQQNACKNDSCLETCDKGFLGQPCNAYLNTRPIMLYCCNGNNNPIAMPISKSPTEEETSSIFRVEKLDGCCATCRVLTLNTEENPTYPFVATNSFFTVNLDAIMCLRCLDDTFVDTI